jgi:hypothetical protein
MKLARLFPNIIGTHCPDSNSLTFKNGIAGITG